MSGYFVLPSPLEEPVILQSPLDCGRWTTPLYIVIQGTKNPNTGNASKKKKTREKEESKDTYYDKNSNDSQGLQDENNDRDNNVRRLFVFSQKREKRVHQ